MKTIHIRQIAKATHAWAVATRNKCRIGEHLGGMCAIASGELFIRLKEAGFDPELYFTDQHCYVVVNNLVVDITARQFGSQYETVTILPLDEALNDDVWGSGLEFTTKSLKKAAEFQEEVDWPKYQRIKLC